VKDGGSARPPLPPPFVARVAARLGDDEARALIAALESPPAIGLRAHPRTLAALGLGSPATLARRLGWAAEPVPWCREGAVLAPMPGDGAPGVGPSPRHPAGRHPWHEAGAYYLQDPSAMAVVPVLDPQPGERILDLAAAPGGKATHVDGRLGATGSLWAHDAVAARADALVANLERWGARTAVVTQGPLDALRALAGAFDRVLVDAPCSGEGMFRKSDAARSQWSPDHVAACARTQADVLDLAADLVRPGGVLVYATCTFAEEENERVIEALLRRRPDLLPEAFALPGAAPGAPGPAAPPALARATARWWPHRQAGEGHFVARLRRASDAPVRRPNARPPRRVDRRSDGGGARPATAAELATWRAFADAVLGGDPLPGHPVVRVADRLLAVPDGVPDGGPVRRRQGVALGRLAPGRFEPDHALSRVLPDLGDGAARLDLALDDPAVLAYARGAALSLPAPDGWLVVRAGGVPLGWGKARAGEVNNRYPRGLRRDLAHEVRGHEAMRAHANARDDG
jgi:16S rRNA C967 or C1407 C5-methylase (RsmB/RsmF family)/NOL1/NOP2/fmu family ribosome biogenesis protein